MQNRHDKAKIARQEKAKPKARIDKGNGKAEGKNWQRKMTRKDGRKQQGKMTKTGKKK